MLNNNNINLLIDVLFSANPEQMLNRNFCDFLNNIFSTLSSSYFDAYEKPATRRKIETIILSLENKLLELNNINLTKQLSESLILFPSRFCGDWSECKTYFSIKDKSFLNNQFKTYGIYCFDKILTTIYQFHFEELLPEILISLSDIFEYQYNNNRDFLFSIITKYKNFIISIIFKSYIQHNSKIKSKESLTNSFEKILNILIKCSLPEAATILDEFNIH